MALGFALRGYVTLLPTSARRAEQKLRGAHPNLSDAMVDLCLARTYPARPSGELIWFHVEDAKAQAAACDLFEMLREERPELMCLLSYSGALLDEVSETDDTMGTAQIDGLYAIPAPVEQPAIIEKFLSHWRPQTLCWLGASLRPALIAQAHQNRILGAYIQTPSARLDTQTTLRAKPLRNAVIALFDHAIVKSESEQKTWLRAGLEQDNISAVGVLEEAPRIRPVNEVGFSEFAQEIGTRPCWFADQITAGEVHDVLAAHDQALRRAHRLLLIVSPRDFAAYQAIYRAAEKREMHLLERVSNHPVSEETQILLTDPDEDENPIWYRAAPICFLGASLTQDGGTSPFAAASHGSAIIHGPHIAKHASIYARFEQGGATTLVRGNSELSRVLCDYLAPDKAADAANKGWQVLSDGAAVTAGALDLLHDLLDLGEAIR